MSTQYDIGDQPRVTAYFVDVDENPADPTAITVQVLKPDGTVDEYDETDMTNPAVGTWVFVLPAPIDQSGGWTVRIAGTATIVAAAEISFAVACSRVLV